ncbi:S-layer homology domain-containing protein [Paenibacillus sp. MMS20-IR301]|uniref:S-layer homology domain-containing protein n=1 Tax=Paenibacillus sp. MMS20-IR301 TaxID=2895946 RepID=UPI0028EE0A76|nr:S-layer homology domain-containing protein [Paenibacillus sp. MMS20-IR301]WNS43543.1 S-layer homology domain-containing protein [Paenibacillus sp. MMS20-IR301]
MVLLLSFLSVLEVSASPLRAGLTSNERLPDGKQKITVNSVVDVTYGDLKVLQGVKFVLQKNDIEIGSQAKARSEAKLTVLDAVYVSMEFSGLTFTGLSEGEEYSLHAEYAGEKGVVVTPSQSIRVPSANGIEISLERMSKDSNTYERSTNSEIRSDDKNIRITVLSNGVPLVGESVAVWSYYRSYYYTTDQNGQIQLKDNRDLEISKSVIYVLLKQGSEQYEAKPLYVTDLQEAGTYTVAIRYLDAKGRLFTQQTVNNYGFSGLKEQIAIPGYTALVLRNGEISGEYSAYITTANNETYFFKTPVSSLYSSVGGIHKEIIEDGSDYSRLTLQYTWDDKPVGIESYSLIDNNRYKQLTNSYASKSFYGNTVYLKKNKEYEFTTVGTASGVAGKIVLRNRFKPLEASHVVAYAAKSSDYSKLHIVAPVLDGNQARILVSYLNERFNYNQVSLYAPAAGSDVYVPIGEQIHRLTTNVGSGSNASNAVVLRSYFTPADNAYTFQAGSQYDTKISFRVKDTNYYIEPEMRSQIVLGESVEALVNMTDEQGNRLDVSSNYKLVIKDEQGEIISDESLSWTTEEQGGNLERINKRDWKPAKSGTYKVQLFPYIYKNNQYVYGELLSEAELKVLPKNELDIEIKGSDGKLVDLVDKPYLTINQAKKVTITVRQHDTGKQGQTVAGVSIRRYSEVLGVTDEQGTFTIPADKANYIGQLTFKKADYLSKSVNVAIINPEHQAVIRVRGLDKAEGDSYAGGIPMDYASILALVKKSDGSYSTTSDYLSTSETQAFLVVDSPSVVGVDFMRYDRNYTGVESKFGYYMYGSVQTEPGKDYSLVLDARQELQEVSKVVMDKPIDELYVVRSELAGASNVPHVIDSNAVNENYFYATQGTYSMLAHTNSGSFVYRDNVVVGAGDNSLSMDDSASGLASLVAPEAGTIYAVQYTTANKSTLQGYAYNANQVQVTPGDVTVLLDQSLGAIEYQYNIHFAPGTLQAGTLTQLAPQALRGIDILGLQNGKLIRPAGSTSLEIGLVDTSGNPIGQIKKPQILVANGGTSSGYKYIYPEQASYEIQDESGKVLYSQTAQSYPLNVLTYDYTEGRYLTNGTYVVKASLTLDGHTYTLDQKVTLESGTGTVVDPGQNPPGTDIGGGDNGGTEPKPTATPTGGSPGGSSPGAGAPGPAATPAPKPAATAGVNENVQKQNDKLQELLKDTAGSAAEKASAAQNALTSIADSLKLVVSSEQAEYNSKNLSSAMDSAAKLLQTIQDPAEKQKIVSSITELVGNAPYLLNKLDSSDKAVEIAHALIENAAAVLNNTQGIKAEEIQKLKNSVVSSSQAALNKAGEVTIAKENVKVDGNAVSSELSSELISTQIQTAKQALQSVSGDLTSKLGAGTAADLQLNLTVKVPPVNEGIHKLNTSLPSEILTLVKENDITGLKIQMDQTAFTIEPDTFGPVAAGQKINLAAEVVENAVINKPSQAEPLASIPVMEFSASVGDQPVKDFAKPVDVTFDVSSIDTSKYSAANLENLTVYLLNEESLTWEAVGGKYDPVTRTVTAPRGHFSKYTVMIGTASFSDVPGTHWAVQEINYLSAKGIVEHGDKFRPSDKITRQQFAAMIARAYGLTGAGQTLPFKDVSATNPYADEIAAAYAAGIITGKSSVAFDPEATISREEIATMLARALTAYNGKAAVAEPAAVNAAFTDAAKISKWATSSVALTKSIQLFEGFEDQSFRPAQTASKAEAAALIYRLYQLK